MLSKFWAVVDPWMNRMTWVSVPILHVEPVYLA